MRWLFERKANQLHGQGVETLARGSPRKRSEPVLSAIVVRALAGNGDGVLAGALGDLTARLVALCALPVFLFELFRREVVDRPTGQWPWTRRGPYQFSAGR
jgi:hypothetical protein